MLVAVNNPTLISGVFCSPSATVALSALPVRAPVILDVIVSGNLSSEIVPVKSDALTVPINPLVAVTIPDAIIFPALPENEIPVPITKS